MFTKQHYERIANVIADTKKYGNTRADGKYNIRNDIANEMADMFEEDNPRFNRTLFMKAAKADDQKELTARQKYELYAR